MHFAFVQEIVLEAKFDEPTTRIARRIMRELSSWITTAKAGSNTEIEFRENVFGKDVDFHIDIQMDDSTGSPEIDGISHPGAIHVSLIIGAGEKLSTILPSLKSVLAHEIEHLRSKNTPWSPPSNTQLEYLLRPGEINAVLAGAYKVAKTLKISMSQAIGEVVSRAMKQDIEENNAGMDELQALRKKAVGELEKAARIKFPQAKFD